MKVEESAVETAITAIEDKKHYQLVDFDNHLDNISLDWRNLSILSWNNEVIQWKHLPAPYKS